MRIPTFSRQSVTDTPAPDERPTTPGGVTPVRPRRDPDDTVTDLPPAPQAAGRTTPPPPPPATASRPVDTDRKLDGDRKLDTDRTLDGDRNPVGHRGVTPPAAAPRPRASLLATLGLVLGVAGVLLVLSGPLLGYGIGVAVLGLILSLAGLRATGKQQVAGKTDALLGMVLALGAIVLGVLALTGSLTWLGTDVQPVSNLREWLDAQFVDRF